MRSQRIPVLSLSKHAISVECDSVQGCCWLAAQRPSNILVYLKDGSAQAFVRGWLLNVPATCWYISRTALLRHLYEVGCLTSQQHVGVSQGRLCSGICTRLAAQRPSNMLVYLKDGSAQAFVRGWLLNVPATCWCISRTALLRQLY